MSDSTKEPFLTVEQCELLMMREPFLSDVAEHLKNNTATALDQLTTDAGAFYGAGDWTVQVTAEKIHVAAPKEGQEPTIARTNAVLQAAYRELSQESVLQEEFGAFMRQMSMPPRVQATKMESNQR